MVQNGKRREVMQLGPEVRRDGGRTLRHTVAPGRLNEALGRTQDWRTESEVTEVIQK